MKIFDCLFFNLGLSTFNINFGDFLLNEFLQNEVSFHR